MYEVSCFEGLEGLYALRSLWTVLLHECEDRSFYNHWHWHYCIARHLIKDKLVYFLVTDQKQPVAIFPLYQTQLKRGGITWKVYSFPRHSHIDLADALVDKHRSNGEIVNCLIKHLRKRNQYRWSLLAFSRFRWCSNFYSLLHNCHHYKLVSSSANAYVRCEQSVPLSTVFSAKHLRNIERLQRRAISDFGELGLLSIDNPREFDLAFESFLQVENASWKGEGGTNSSIKSNKQTEGFYRELLHGFAESGSVCVNLLTVAGKPIAGQFCLKCDNCYYLLKIGYDAAYSAVAPGNILLKMFIESCSRKHESFEVNLVTNPPWAERWDFHSKPVYRLDIYNKAVVGHFVDVVVWVRQRWRDIRNRITSLFRKRSHEHTGN